MKTEILKFLDDSGLPHSRVLHFFMDGPAVNLSILKLITEQFATEDDVLPLVVIGTCSLYPVHTWAPAQGGQGGQAPTLEKIKVGNAHSGNTNHR